MRAAPRACLALVLSGCASQVCVDRDGDGYGRDCALGPDCDDQNADLAATCLVETADCDGFPEAQGCPCRGGRAPRPCYAASEETRDVGECRGGRNICFDGNLTRCEGMVLPQSERCNGLDDDCDGRTDERVLSPCGGCDGTCVGAVWGPEDQPFVGESPLALSTRGDLTLARTPSEALTVWVGNTADGTLSKLDAERAQEVARYRVGGEGVLPVRVAVDHEGDVWVLSRSPTGAALTKLAGDPMRCVDRDGAGLETSTGPDEVLPFGVDECVLLHQPVGSRQEGPGSLAVDGTITPDGVVGGDAWVGLDSGRLVRLSGKDGEVRATVDLPDMVPHAARFDSWGLLWLLDRTGRLSRLNPIRPEETLEVLEPPVLCYTLESLAFDPDGELLLSGFACENVISFAPLSARWDRARADGVLSTRGVALLAEHGWVVHTAGLISRVQRSPLAFDETFSLASEGVKPVDSAALSADGHGQLWVISRLGGVLDRGVATRFDPEEGVVTAQVTVGVGPRTLGDFTGHALGGSFAPTGAERHVFYGCEIPSVKRPARGEDGGVSSGSTIWKRLHVTSTAGEGGRIELAVRQANTLEALADSTFETVLALPGDELPVDLSLPKGGVLEAELRLLSEHHIGAPRVYRVGVEWVCPGPE